MPKRSSRRSVDTPMTCFEVYCNGKKVRTAGIKKGMLVFDLIHFTRKQKLSPVTHFRIGGISHESDDDKGEHVLWAFRNVNAGDEFRIRVVKRATCDEPIESKPREPRKRRRARSD